MKKSNHTSVLLRYLFISVVILAFAGCILYSLFKTTIINADKWNELADKELSDTSPIKPERGDILACDGSILATNLRYYTLRIDFRSEKFMWSRYTNVIDTLADSLQRYFPIKGGTQAWRDSLVAPINKVNKPRSWRLLQNISYSDYLRVKSWPFFSIKNPNRNGLVKEERMRRRNPYGDMARRSIGMVSERSSGPQKGQIHGHSGLEYALDSLLYGVPGRYKKIALTRGIVNWTDTAAQRGYDIRTTIDIKIQDIVENELNTMLEFTKADWGVAVLMDVATGDIKAISNLERHPRRVGTYIEGMNRAVLGFEPGSVVKTLSMMIAVEDGLVHNLDSVVLGSNSPWPYAGGRSITDSHHISNMTVADVIEQSSNIGMARIITRFYNDKPSAWRERIARTGFLDKLNIGIGGERAPFFPKLKDDRGGRISLSRMSYGYATEIPPLHTLSIYNAIANDGKYVRPRLIRGIKNESVDSTFDVSYVHPQVCSPATASKMRKMLKRVVWGNHGTARLLRNDFVEIAGKTGTCWMVDKDTKRYNPAHKRLAFCGFFPADEPKYSCIVLVAHPREGAFGAASTSGTVLKNIALKLYSRGMLDNESDFRINPNLGTRPTFYASTKPSKMNNVAHGLGIGSTLHLREPKTAVAENCVPDVVGLGMREAVSRLEEFGYNVTFTGAGYVAMQTPPADTPLPRGSEIMLQLKE